MLVAALLLSVQAVPVATPPSAEAEALGARLARTGVLAIALPSMMPRTVDDLLRQHPELSAADRTALRLTAETVADREIGRILDAEGRQFAAALSIEDLRTLVASAVSPAGAHLRAAMPRILAATAQALGSADFNDMAWREFCAQPGRRCPTAR